MFQVDEDFTIPVARPIAYAVERDGKAKDVGVARGVASPKGADQLPFGTPPKVGDALYLGFDVPLGRLLLQVDVDCSQAKGAGVDPEDPPLVWEVGAGDGEWLEAEVLEDRTGGFNYGSGTLVELQLPDRSAPENIAGTRAHWLRCRLADRPRSGGEAIKGSAFTHPPEIYSITAAPIGGLVPRRRPRTRPTSCSGRATGRRARASELRYSPMLAPSDGERLEVLNATSGDWEPWDLVESFVESGPEDPHYALDLANGVVELGPGGQGRRRELDPVRDDSSEKGPLCASAATATAAGDAATSFPDTLTILRSAIPGVAAVTNPRPALGGVDSESLDAARLRAALEFRTRFRAVTADDFAFLAREATPRVARAACVPPENGGPVRLYILPRVDPPDRKLSYEELVPTDDLYAEVGEYLDERRLIGTTVELAPMKLRGMSVVVNLQAVPRTDVGRIEEEVAYALYTYLNPFVGGSLEGPGDGGGTSAGRSTRESCTGSSMPFRASTT